MNRLRFEVCELKGVVINSNASFGLIHDLNSLTLLKKGSELSEVSLENFKLIPLPDEQETEYYFYKKDRTFALNKEYFEIAISTKFPKKIYRNENGLTLIKSFENYIIAPVEIDGEFQEHSCMNFKNCNNLVYENEDLWLLDINKKIKSPFCSYNCLKDLLNNGGVK